MIGENIVRVAILSYWSNRGQGVLARGLCKALRLFGFDVTILARTDRVSGPPRWDGEWRCCDNIVPLPAYDVPAGTLARLARDVDCFVFVEEQWGGEALTHVAREQGARVIGIPMSEFLRPDYFIKSAYDVVLCPTRFCHKLCGEIAAAYRSQIGSVPELVLLPWFWEDAFFMPPPVVVDEIVFFHPAGWGGLAGRRGTALAYTAFVKAFGNAPGVRLVVQGQRKLMEVSVPPVGVLPLLKNVEFIWEDLPLHRLVQLWRSSHVALLPSLWEGVGLTFLEAIAACRPIVTVDAPPMNEYVPSGGGELCRVSHEINVDGVGVRGAVANVEDLACKLRHIAGGELLSLMSERMAATRRERAPVTRRKLFEEVFIGRNKDAAASKS